MEGGKYRLAKRMRLAGRIIVLASIGFGGTMLIGEAIGELLQEGWAVITKATPTDPGVLLGVIGAVALAGCILSWWRERLASILLVLTAAGFGIHIGLVAGRNHFLVWLMMGFPYLVASVLLFISWRLSQKTLEESKEA